MSLMEVEERKGRLLSACHQVRPMRKIRPSRSSRRAALSLLTTSSASAAALVIAALKVTYAVKAAKIRNTMKRLAFSLSSQALHALPLSAYRYVLFVAMPESLLAPQTPHMKPVYPGLQ